MSVIESVHADHGAAFGDRGGRTVVEHYGRPERTHRAVRNGVGLIEPAYGIVAIEGADRVEYVDNVVTNRVPTADGEGRRAFVLDPQGGIEHDLAIYDAGERLLLFTPPDRAEPLAAEWREKVFIQDVEIDVATDEFAVFGVHGPHATEKVASVLGGVASPDGRHSFVRGTVGDAGVSVIRTDAPCGEESYEVVCAAADAEAVFGALLTRGVNAAPFGYRTWETLTLEAGTPLFESELAGEIPNVVGQRGALDFEKGCYVGQEVVSRVENRGRPSQRLVGLTIGGTEEVVDGDRENVDGSEGTVPEAGAAVFAGDSAVGEVTRAATSPILERPIALALVDYDLEDGDLAVRVGGEEVTAERTELPFVEGSERSGRLPEYPEDER